MVAYDMIAEPAGYTNRDGLFVPSGATASLVLALRKSQPGDRIGFKGNMGQIRFSFDPNRENAKDINNPVSDVTVEGMDDTAVLEGIWFNNPTPGYNHDLTFRNFTLLGRSQRPVAGQAHTLGWGTIAFERIHCKLLEGMDPRTVKWWFHLHFEHTGRFSKVIALDGCDEHVVYAHSPKVNPREPEEPSLIVEDCWFGNTGRTGTQYVLRDSGRGETSSGTMIFRRNHYIDCGWRKDGGSALTVAGHLGPVIVEDNMFVSDAMGAHGVPDRGAVVFYRDSKQKEILTPDGFAVGPVTYRRNWVSYTNPDREVVMVSDCDSLDMTESNIIQTGGGRNGLHLEKTGPNGANRFHGRSKPSVWRGMQAGPVLRSKMQMTDSELDALWVNG